MMGKRFWLVHLAVSIAISGLCWAVEQPTVAVEPAQNINNATSTLPKVAPTSTEPVWNSPDGSYTRFWVASGTFHVLVDDITGDGRQDLAFTTHSTGMIQIFRQTEARHFAAVGEQDIPGFHPNDTIALPGSPKRYVINGEGDGRLRIVAAQADGRLTRIADYKIAGPLSTTPFSWPNWGLGLAVVPYSGPLLHLLREFNPETGIPKTVFDLQTGADIRPVRLADFKGNGIPALVFPSFNDNKVWIVEYPGPERAPTPRLLKTFAGGWPRHVIPFDINRDGKLDLLVPMSVEQRIAVLLNDGQDQFTEAESIAYPGPVGINAMVVANEGGDRYWLAGGIRSLVLYRERREKVGHFETIAVPLLNWPTRLELVDVDGDKALDAVMGSAGQSTSMVIYGPLWDAFGKLAANPPDNAKPD